MPPTAHPYLLLTIALALLAAIALGAWLQFRARSWLRARRAAPGESPYAEMPTRMAMVGEWPIHFHLSGRGPYLVLLHGIGANLFCWRHLVPLLRRRYTVVALDLPGFGRSGKLGPARYGLDEQTERLEQFFRHLGIRRAVVVGNSMGGNIALWFSLRYPGRVAGTVVIAPATSPRLVPLSPERVLWLSRPVSAVLTRTMMRWAHHRTVSKKHLVDRERVENTFETYGGNGEAVRSFLLATETIRDARLAQRLRKLKGRVLILWGTRDRLVPRRVITELEAALKRKVSHAHEGGGHHLQEDEPEWVAERINAFLAGEDQA